MSDAQAAQDGLRDEQVAKLAQLIHGIRVCMFTTSDADSRLMSRPKAVRSGHRVGPVAH